MHCASPITCGAVWEFPAPSNQGCRQAYPRTDAFGVERNQGMHQAPGQQERQRLAEDETRERNWKRWGPYLSERQWGTVREDYSGGGSSWNYFSHDQSRSRAYRWGEDGLGGFCDDKQRLCFSLALWNERDPILKERLFGLTNSEGNHGE